MALVLCHSFLFFIFFLLKRKCILAVRNFTTRMLTALFIFRLFVDGIEIDGIAQTFICHIISSSVNFVVNNAN